jgi:signal transduction histidine kinase
MNLQTKLGLLFGSLTFLLIVSAALSYVLVRRIDNDVQNLGRVVAPLKEAVLEMQISIGEGNKSIIQYSIDRDDRHIRRFLETNIDFQVALQEFTRLAETDAEKEAGQKVGQIHGGFEEISDDIIGVTNNLQANLTRLSQDVANIDRLLNDQLEGLIDRDAPDGLTKLEAVLNMGTRVDKAFLAVQSYLASPDPKFRRTVIEEQEGFRAFEAVFRSSRLSINEELVVGVIHDVFLGTVTLGTRVMNQADEQRILLVNLADDIEKIDRIVVEDVQPLIIAETADALDGAEASVEVATYAVFVLIALGAVVGVGTAVIVARQIVNPIVRLTNVAFELGQGNLGVRASASTRDEIGSLANSFNQMAAARQQAEAQRVTLIAELAAQNAELAQLDELKDNFLSSVSHELRTPLTAIKGSAEILLDDDEVPEEVVKEFLTIINVESDRLTRLINDVLDLARYEAGQEIWNDAPNSLSEIVDTAVSGIQSLAIQKSLNVSVDLEPDLSDVWCDQDKINQVLTNLLSNAIKFTPEHGKIGILIKEASNSGRKKSDRMVEIKVSDNGVGISAEELNEIFQKFKQVSDTVSDVRKGTGLGLPICREIVSHYGGKIWAESELGKGSVFTVTIPIEKSAVEADSPPAEESGASQASSV